MGYSMAILCVVQFLSGMILVLLSPSLSHVLETLGITETGGGTLFFAYFSGGTVGTLTLSWLPRFLSSARILQLSGVLAGLGLLGVSLSPSLGPALSFFALVGAGNSLLVAYPGALLAGRYREASGRMMSFLYAFFALGVTLCPLVSGFLLQAGVPWQAVFQAMALVCLAVALPAGLSRIPSMNESEGLRWKSMKAAIRGDRGLLIGAVLLNVLYIGAETSVMGWVVYYLQRVFAGDTNVFRASRVLTYFWILMIVGRLLTALVAERAGSFTVLVVLGSGGILTWSGAMASGNLVTSEVLFAFTGLFFSGMFPMIASYAGRFPVQYTGLAFSLILAGGGMGGALFPLLVGWLSERQGMQVGLASAISGLFLMLVLLVFLRTRGARV